MRWFLQIAGIVALAASVTAARADGLTAPELRDARKLYIAKCARCHKLHDPSKYTDVAWEEWMNKMSRKAKLKTDQKELLSRYIATFRHGEGTSTLPARPVSR